MPLSNPLTVRAQMRIRRPVHEVFEAFVDPAITTRFWFTHSTGRLEPGRTVRWTWARFDVSTDVDVLAVEQDRRILVAWDEPRCPVEWRFESDDVGHTWVYITTSGFQGSDDAIVEQAIDSKGGFTMVLAALKALLEHGIELRVVADQFPSGALR